MEYHSSHKTTRMILDSTIARILLTNATKKLVIYILITFLFSFLISYSLLTAYYSSSKTALDSGIMDYLAEQDTRHQIVQEIREYGPEYLLDPHKFYVDHVSYGIPFILRGYMNDWEAVKKWNDDEYMLSKIGKESIEVETRTGSGSEFASFQKEYTRATMKYKKFVSLYANEDLDEKYYWAEQKLPEVLQADLGQFDFADFMNLEDINIWQGAVGTVSLPHMDGRDNFLCQITGHKDLVIIPPTQTVHLYTKENKDWPRNYSPVDFYESDLDKYPDFKNVNMKFRVRINPGDVIYIPSFWWHHIKSSKGKNIAVNYWFTNSYMGGLLGEYLQDI